MQMQVVDPAMVAQVHEIVAREKAMSLSEREWKHRLRGYGYALTDTAHGRVVTKLATGAAICTLTDAAA